MEHQSDSATQNKSTKNESDSKNVFTVESIIDGRTIKVRNAAKSMTVTLNGLQVPTDDSKYQKAVEDRIKKDLSGKKVTLVKTQGNDYDVILGGHLEQYSLISNGFGVIDKETINADRYSTELNNAQQPAKNAKSGVWEVPGYVDDGYFNPEVLE